METRHDPNGLQPHAFSVESPRVRWAPTGIIPFQRQSPENFQKNHESEEQSDFDALFELMAITEEAHNYLTNPSLRPPIFGREGLEIQRTVVINNIIESKLIIKEMIERSKGIPVRLTEESGIVLQGRIVAKKGFEHGCWELEMINHDQKSSTIFKTAEQLREGFIAATTTSSEELHSTEEF